MERQTVDTAGNRAANWTNYQFQFSPKLSGWMSVPMTVLHRCFRSFFSFLKGNKVQQNVLKHLNKTKKVSWGNKRFSFRADSNSISRPTNHFEKARQNVEMKIWWIVMICTTFYLCTSSPPRSLLLYQAVYTLLTQYAEKWRRIHL